MKKTEYRIAERDGLLYPQVRQKTGWIYWGEWKTIYMSAFGRLDTYYIGTNWTHGTKNVNEARILIYLYELWLRKEQELNEKIKYHEVESDF